jgi:hypothetical protein
MGRNGETMGEICTRSYHGEIHGEICTHHVHRIWQVGPAGALASLRVLGLILKDHVRLVPHRAGDVLLLQRGEREERVVYTGGEGFVYRGEGELGVSLVSSCRTT